MTDGTARPALATRTIDITVGLVLAGGFLGGLWATRDYYFWIDDWLLVRQSGSLGGLVDHYNGHLSILILGLYRVLIEVFGFEYVPFQVVGLLCLVAVPATYYVTNRRPLGAALAAILSVSMLPADRAFLFAAELNHSLALVGGILCAAALNRGRRADPWIALALAFSLASAGGGVAVAAACVVHNLCTRAPWRRWLAVVTPLLLWAGWWLVFGRGYWNGDQTTATETLRIAWDLAFATFSSLGHHHAALGILLMVAFVSYGVWLLRQGLDQAASWLAWTAALAVWGVGLARNRGDLTDPHAFRYQLLGIGFVFLAVVPRRPLGWRAGSLGRIDPRWALVAIVLVAGVQARALAGDVGPHAEYVTRASTLTRGRVIILRMDPPVVPDDRPLPFEMGLLRAGQVRALLDRHGTSLPDGRDEVLVAMGVPSSTSLGVQDRDPCAALTAPFFQPVETAGLQLWAQDEKAAVQVRRFGATWIDLDDAQPGEVLRVRLPGLASDTPWEVRAIGACRSGTP